MQILILLLIIASIVDAVGPTGQLLIDRMKVAHIMVERANNETLMLYAIDNFLTDDAIHTIQDTGDFGPLNYLKEYNTFIFRLGDILGANPVILKPRFDPYTTSWVSHDILEYYYFINISASWNGTQYTTVGDGFRFHGYLEFENSTSIRIKHIYDIQDPDAIEMFFVQGDGISSTYICENLVFPACTGPYLSDTSYTSIEDCISFMNTVRARNKCPFPGKSDTTDCRILHAWMSFFDPATHCAHTSRSNPVCSDKCFPACSNCHPNAECVVVFQNIFTSVYQCQCKNGYQGNGSHCTPLNCNRGRCDIHPKDTHTCTDDNLCVCDKTFTWDPLATNSRDRCKCVGGKIWSNGTKKICVPTGRCLEDKHCTTQKHGTAQCRPYGTNPFSRWNNCLCNYGYSAGMEYDCFCPSERREVHSSLFGEKICILPTECTENRHCKHKQHCQRSGMNIDVWKKNLDLENGEVKDVKIELGTMARSFRKNGSVSKEIVTWLNNRKPILTKIRLFCNPFDEKDIIVQLYYEGEWRIITRISGYLCVYEISGCSLLVKFFA